MIWKANVETAVKRCGIMDNSKHKQYDQLSVYLYRCSRIKQVNLCWIRASNACILWCFICLSLSLCLVAWVRSWGSEGTRTGSKELLTHSPKCIRVWFPAAKRCPEATFKNRADKSSFSWLHQSSFVCVSHLMKLKQGRPSITQNNTSGSICI